MKTVVISILALVLASSTWAGNGNGAGLNQAPINTNSFYNMSISTDNARVVGLFLTDCESASCAVTLHALRLASLTEKAKPQIICADSVCSALERDIVTVGVGADVAAALGLSGGYAGGADAEVSVDVGVGFGGGLEFNVTGPMKLKPQNGNDFQSGGNILSESGFGTTMFSEHVMIGTRRFFGVTGTAKFYGEKSPDSQLMLGALGRTGVPVCSDEASNTVTCPIEVINELQRLCNDQNRCRDTDTSASQTRALAADTNSESRFGGFDQDELDEAMQAAQGIVDMLKADITNRQLASRLSDIQELFAQMQDQEMRTSLRDELQNTVSSELEELLTIVTSNSRFPEVNLARIEDLPEVRDITEAVAELLNPLLASPGETAQQTADNTKARFCATGPGQRRVFDRYCGR